MAVFSTIASFFSRFFFWAQQLRFQSFVYYSIFIFDFDGRIDKPAVPMLFVSARSANDDCVGYSTRTTNSEITICS